MALSPFNVTDLPTLTGDLVTPSDTVAVPGNPRYLRCTSAAALVLRYPGSAADITLTVSANEYVPVGPGVIVRATGTVTTPIHAFGC